MSDLNVKTWVRTPAIYGRPISIDELDYANGLYLAHCEEHPNESKPFETVIISNDLDHWQHRTSSPAREFPMKNVRITGAGDRFVIVGTSVKDDGNHLTVMTSENGFDWHDKFETEDSSPNYQSTIVKSLGGGVVGCCIGQLVYSNNLEEWHLSKFTGKYVDYTAVDITYFNSKFFVLLKKEDSYAIGYTTSLQEYRFYDLEWGNSKPQAIENNGSQMVIVCSEGLAERCAIYYTSDGTKSDWSRIEVKPPFRSITNSLSELCSLAWNKDEWVFVGRIREWNNSRSMLFSYMALIYRSVGDLNPETTLILDETDSRDLTYIQNINDKLFAYGKSHPNGENCFFTLE